MGFFAKVAADVHRHPKIRRGGRNAREVFLFVLAVNADRGATGRVPASFVEPWYLADTLQCSEDEARDGLERAVAARLIELDQETGDALIVGWDDDEWGRGAPPLTPAERAQRYRDRHGPSRGVTPDRDASRPVTIVTTGEERRSESEEIQAPPLARDPAVPAPTPAPAPQPEPTPAPAGDLTPLLSMTVARLNVARRKLGARDLPVFGGQPERDLVDRLRETPASERESALSHCLDVLIAESERDGNAGNLRLAMLAGPKAWPRLLAMTVADVNRGARGRDGPGGKPKPRLPPVLSPRKPPTDDEPDES